MLQTAADEVQVGDDQEKSQAERHSQSKNRVGKIQIGD